MKEGELLHTGDQLKMTKCKTSGHRNLQYICKDCGMVVGEQRVEDGWINVKERLPENVPILAFRDGECELTGGEVLEWDIGFTHWRPIPEPPK